MREMSAREYTVYWMWLALISILWYAVWTETVWTLYETKSKNSFILNDAVGKVSSPTLT